MYIYISNHLPYRGIKANVFNYFVENCKTAALQNKIIFIIYLNGYIFMHKTIRVTKLR